MNRRLLMTVLLAATVPLFSHALDIRIGATVNYDNSTGTTLASSITGVDSSQDFLTSLMDNTVKLDYVTGDGFSLEGQFNLFSNGIHTLGTQLILEGNLYNGVRYKDKPYNDNTLELPLLINYTFTKASVLDVGIGIGPYLSYQIHHKFFNIGACLSIYTAILQGSNGHVKIFARYYNDFTSNGDYTRRMLSLGCGFDYKIFDTKK